VASHTRARLSSEDGEHVMAIRVVDIKPPKAVVVHAVVHAPKPVVVHKARSGDRHKDTEGRRAYRAEWMRRRRAGAKGSEPSM
jgi:hypothetical protein